MKISIIVEMGEPTDPDTVAYRSLSPADQNVFLVAKLAAMKAPVLMAALTKSDVLAKLSTADQSALATLIAAVKEME